MYQLIINPLAEEDAKNAANWYNEKQEGLGNEFLLSLDALFNAIQRNPNQYETIYRELKRAFTSRFPYAVFFIVEGNIISVLAILHTSRSPKIWKGRKKA